MLCLWYPDPAAGWARPVLQELKTNLVCGLRVYSPAQSETES